MGLHDEIATFLKDERAESEIYKFNEIKGIEALVGIKALEEFLEFVRLIKLEELKRLKDVFELEEIKDLKEFQQILEIVGSKNLRRIVDLVLSRDLRNLVELEEFNDLVVLVGVKEVKRLVRFIVYWAEVDSGKVIHNPEKNCGCCGGLLCPNCAGCSMPECNFPCTCQPEE